MKNIFVLMTMVLALNVNAAESKKSVQPSEAEIQQNRACFAELKSQGCGDPGEDAEYFTSCMSGLHETLEGHCKELMLKLYGSN